MAVLDWDLPRDATQSPDAKIEATGAACEAWSAVPQPLWYLQGIKMLHTHNGRQHNTHVREECEQQSHGISVSLHRQIVKAPVCWNGTGRRVVEDQTCRDVKISLVRFLEASIPQNHHSKKDVHVR